MTDSETLKRLHQQGLTQPTIAASGPTFYIAIGAAVLLIALLVMKKKKRRK